MKQAFIALLGFLPDMEARLKEVIQQNMTFPVNWVNAKNPDLSGVVINADFLASANIQKYVKNTEANAVCCYRDDFGKELSERYQMNGMHINERSHDTLKGWIGALTKEKTLASVGLQQDNESLSSVAHSVPDDFRLLIEAIKNRSGLLYAVDGEKETWIDIEKNETHFNYSLQDIPSITSMLWKKVESLEYPGISRVAPANLWVFEAVWRAKLNSELDELSDDKLYKITRWPRPLSKKSQTEIIRLAAFTQKKFSTIKEIGEKTGYPKEDVKRFLYASSLIGQLKMIGASDASQSNIPEAKKEPVDEKTLGLLGRLRRKLNLA